MKKKTLLKKAIKMTLPVLTGYVVLGMGFGILAVSSGLGVEVPIIMSMLIYAGSMQFAAVGLLTGGVSLIGAALTTFMVNARHIFYGISMIDKYRRTGAYKPYLIFSLTDETYSLLCMDDPELERGERGFFFFLVSMLDQCYWVIGTALGAILGSVIKFNTEGIDFSLTALFVTIFLDQWLGTKNHAPAIIGVLVSALCLVIFGSESFLIPSMLVIALILCVYREEKKND